ncbi:MAG: hypothetical protein EZS28_054301, partial [Streblomastix strix]
IKTATFHGMGNLSFKLRFIAFGSDRFATYFDAFEWKQLREEQQSDKQLFDVAVDPI